jgi:thiosulfate/3-mercaptopyruvate sulfurtransferase
MRISPIIEVEELLKIYKNFDVMIFDVSNSKNAKTNYETEHIEGAFFVDLNTQLADIKSDFSDGGRHPLPSTENFAKTLTDLGISKDKHIVIYDDKNGSNASARFWWMLKSVGHEKVQVLNGGLNQAKKNNFPLCSKTESIQKHSEPYKISQWNLPTIEIDEVEKISQNPNYLVVDVRDQERYDGKIEPIDLIAGHIPGATNIPFTENLDQSGLFLSPNDLRNKYEKLFGEINPKNVIVHCGSGVTACHTLLALHYAEIETPKLYVGSWSEWSRNNKEIEKTTNMGLAKIVADGILLPPLWQAIPVPLTYYLR